MLGRPPDRGMQGFADRQFDFDLDVVGIEGDLVQLHEALSLHHPRGETELLQDRVRPGEKPAFALGLGLRMRLGVRLLREGNKIRH